jgi:hypothetical protein
MSQIIRQILSKMNVFVLSRRSAPRFARNVPITVTIGPEKLNGCRETKKGNLSIKGQTKDLSESGIAFFIDSIRLQEHYLIGEDRVLSIELELPNGTIQMQVVGVRYEQFDMHESIAKYMIGAQIKSIEPLALEIYKDYLRLGDRVNLRNELPILELDIKES